MFKVKNKFKTKHYEKEFNGEINVDVYNPERGIYEQRHTKVSEYAPLDVPDLVRCREVKKEALVLRMFNLDALKETEIIPEDVKQKIDNDFATAREAGIKLIVRFCYTEDPKLPDASKKVVLAHINQLKPIIFKNHDVIFAVQAGFIGTWGEWYYTNEDFGNKGHINDIQSQNRKEVVQGLLDMIPHERFLLMRTPQYKMKYLGHNRTITNSDVQARSESFRIGFHNDAFLADETDMGTYTCDSDKTYFAFDSRYVPVLGETCKPGPQANGQRAINQLSYYHWNALNRQYHPDVIKGWKEDNTYPEIKSRLGYRYILIKAEVDHYPSLDKPVKLNLTILNDGFSISIYPKTFFVIIENKETSERFTIQPDKNPEIRLWYPDETVEVPITFSLASVNPPTGKYNVYLDISDYQFLHRPEYRVVFSNIGVEEPETRLNNLGISFTYK
jgi:hypothetical protein